LRRWDKRLMEEFGFSFHNAPRHVDARSKRVQTLYRWLSLPWLTVLITVIIILIRSHLPPLTDSYILSGVAGSVAVARFGPNLRTHSPPSSNETDARRQSTSASRHTLLWSLITCVALPWIPSSHRVLEWLGLVLPMSFAWRTLLEPWWLTLGWRLAVFLSVLITRLCHL